MKIEITCRKGSSTKQKGDLLEKLAKKLLLSQNYHVIEEVRVIGAELDLLCKHKVNNKEIYVECKAQKDRIAAPILRQLWGTVDSQEYAEGWLISTSDFTKDATGFIENWKKKPIEKSSRLSFYNPDVILEALQSASIIVAPPIIAANNIIGIPDGLGEWTLLICEYGMYWCVYTLKGGTPYGVLVFSASHGHHIQDEDTIQNLSDLDTVLSDYNLQVGLKKILSTNDQNLTKLPIVVEVQIGDSWHDYRPARPKDFVGRDSTQKDILSFLNSAKDSYGSRIFAITGNSGLGKSSLIAKLRDRARNQHYKNKYFIYAVDIRGAREPSYIPSSLIQCLREAQKKNFGDNIELTLTDPSSPLNSTSIQSYLESIEKKGQVVCLVFDQFEELYSKPELFGIFKAAKDLMLDIAGYKSNLVLGFAWKTDSITQQDHPAYHMWHELADHRKEYRLDVFDRGEILNSMTKFEKEVNQKIPAGTRHQILQASQGFPWLLKKLCINLYEGIVRGEKADTLLVELDVKSLFEADLNLLSIAELACLRLIAQKAPADWSEIIEIYGPNTLNNLVQKRLIVKSGDRLNIYWDIFKDYLLMGNVPIIPYNYIPSTDSSSIVNVCLKLKADIFMDSYEIGRMMNLTEKTVWNIGADLVMLGLADREGTRFKISDKVEVNNEQVILSLLREKISNHSLKLSLFKKYLGKRVNQQTIQETLKECIPKAKFGEKTWTIYANRLTNYLIYSGFLEREGLNLIVRDTGNVITNRTKLPRGRRSEVFIVTVAPIAVLNEIHKILDPEYIRQDTPRNILAAFKRLGLIVENNRISTLDDKTVSNHSDVNKFILDIVLKENSLLRCIKLLEVNPKIKGKELGEIISQEYSLSWAEATQARAGHTLRQWSLWVKDIQNELPLDIN